MLTKKIWTRIAIAIVLVVILFFVYRKFTKKSEYVIPPTSTSDTDSTRQQTYSSNLNNCETFYINAMNANLSISDATQRETANATANTVLNNCISSNVVAYYNSRCPFLTNTAGAITGSSLVSNTSNVTYLAYQADINAINAVYTPLIAAAGQVQSVNIIQAARKADFTGASRKFFATLCPDLYSNAGGSTLQTRYQGWSNNATTGTTYGFQPSRVTTSNIWQWATYAGMPPTISGDSYTAPTSHLLNTPTVTVSCAANGVSGGAAAAYIASTGGIPNWQLAADNGPGTINNSITLPWATWVTPSAGLCPPGAGTYISGASATTPLP